MTHEEILRQRIALQVDALKKIFEYQHGYVFAFHGILDTKIIEHGNQITNYLEVLIKDSEIILREFDECITSTATNNREAEIAKHDFVSSLARLK